MARSFTTTGRVDTPAIGRPAALTLMAWVRSPGTAAEAFVWSHSSSSGTKLSFQTNGDLRYQRSHATTDGVWTVAAAAINAVVTDREQWFCVTLTHDGSNNANNAVVRVGTESTGLTAVTVTRTTGPSGAVSTSSSGNPRWGNNASASGALEGDMAAPAYHSAVLSTGAQDTWRTTPSPAQANCEVAYLLDASSPADDLSSNNRDGTITGTAVVSGPTVGGGAQTITGTLSPSAYATHAGTVAHATPQAITGTSSPSGYISHAGTIANAPPPGTQTITGVASPSGYVSHTGTISNAGGGACLLPGFDVLPGTDVYPTDCFTWPGQAAAVHRPQVHIADGRGFAIRHIRPGAGEGTAVTLVNVLGTQMGFEWLPMSTLPTSPDLVEGTYTRRLGDAGEFTLRFPNVAGSKGLWREKFSEAGALEWIEIYRDGVLEFTGVIQRVEVTRSAVTISGGDGMELLKRAYERDRTWAHAPADVIDHYTQVWVEEFHEDWDDTSAWTLGVAGSLTAVNGQGLIATDAVSAAAVANHFIQDIDGDWEIETGMRLVTDPFGLGATVGIRLLRASPLQINGAYINNSVGGGTSRYGLVTAPNGVYRSVLGTIAGDNTQWSIHHQIRIRRAGRWLMAWVDGRLAMAAETGVGSLGNLLQISVDFVGPYAPGGPNIVTGIFDPITFRRLRPLLRRGATRGDLVLPGDHPVGGLRGRYHNRAADSGYTVLTDHRIRALSPVSEPYGQRLDPVIDTTAGLTLPLKPGAADDWFGARWTGAIWLPLGGGPVDVRLTGVDDAGRLWVRDTRWGQQVVDGWYSGPGTTEGTFSGEADGWYPIVIEMAEDAGSSGIRLQVRGRGWTDPGGTAIPADTWTSVPATSLSPLGCHEGRIQGQSHFQIVTDVAAQAGYQLLLEPMSLESGEFPGRLIPRLRVGRDTDVVLEVDDTDAAEPIMDPAVTRDAAEHTTRLVGAGAGSADGKGSQTMVEVADHTTPSLFDLESWIDAGDATLEQLLEARVNAELALRSTPWEEVRGVPRGLERLADTWPLTGELSAMRWRPGDGLRVAVPDIGVLDRECRQLTQVTRQFAAEGRTATQVAWRQRPRSAAAALRRLALSQALGRRSYQPQHQTLVSSYISNSVAAGATTDFAIIPLQPQDRVVRAVVRVSHNPGGGTLGMEINGTARTSELGGGWTTVPLEIDITPFASQATATDNRLYVRLSRTGGSVDVLQFQVIVEVLR